MKDAGTEGGSEGTYTVARVRASGKERLSTEWQSRRPRSHTLACHGACLLPTEQSGRPHYSQRI